MDTTVILAIIGIITSILGGIAFLGRYFTGITAEKDKKLYEYIDKFTNSIDNGNKTTGDLTKAIEANTKATSDGVEMTKKSNDNLTLVLAQILNKRIIIKPAPEEAVKQP